MLDGSAHRRSDDTAITRLAKVLLLEEEFKVVLHDRAELMKLWSEIDLNDNGDIGSSEWGSYIKMKFDILSQSKPTSKALEESTQQKGGKQQHLGKSNFKCFIQAVFKFTKLFFAYQILDQSGDNRVVKSEYVKRAEQFKEMLMIDMRRMPSTLDGEFSQLAAMSGEKFISYSGLCAWYKNYLDGGGDEDGTGAKEPEFDDSGLLFDINHYEDCVMHCHYLTRVTTMPLNSR